MLDGKSVAEFKLCRTHFGNKYKTAVQVAQVNEHTVSSEEMNTTKGKEVENSTRLVLFYYATYINLLF